MALTVKELEEKLAEFRTAMAGQIDDDEVDNTEIRIGIGSFNVGVAWFSLNEVEWEDDTFDILARYTPER